MTLVLGIGARVSAGLEEIEALITETLAQQGFSTEDVSMVATLVAKRDLLAPLCAEHRWELVTHTSEELAQVEVRSRSVAAQRAVCTPSVAEAAARLHGTLLVGKTASRGATVAVARQV